MDEVVALLNPPFVSEVNDKFLSFKGVQDQVINHTPLVLTLNNPGYLLIV